MHSYSTSLLNVLLLRRHKQNDFTSSFILPDIGFSTWFPWLWMNCIHSSSLVKCPFELRKQMWRNSSQAFCCKIDRHQLQNEQVESKGSNTYKRGCCQFWGIKSKQPFRQMPATWKICYAKISLHLRSAHLLLDFYEMQVRRSSSLKWFARKLPIWKLTGNSSKPRWGKKKNGGVGENT